MRSNSEIIDIIVLEKDRQNLSLSELARRVGLAKSAMSRYLNKTRQFPLNRAQDFANVLGISVEYLLGVENSSPSTSTVEKITLIADQLTPPRQAKALTYLEKQLLEQKNENIVSENIISLDDYRKTTYRRVTGVVSAGSGSMQDDDLDMEVSFYDDEIPDDYDAIAYVVGNSMEPKIKNGDYLFIKNTPQVDYNTIGIFQVDGANYVKKLRQGYLESLNPDYADIQLDESNDIRTIGEVVGIYREN